MADTTPTNVLIIMADELRNDLVLHQWYPHIRTPHLDSLRGRGATFANAFCQTPTCVPSRGSFVGGKYPHQIGLYDHSCTFPSEERSIGHHFASDRYESVAFGKTHGMCPGFDSHTYDVVATMASNNHGYNLTDADAVGAFDGPEDEYCDFVAVRQFAEYLDRRNRPSPFLAFVGIYAPHPPLYPPRRYADMYADAPVEIPTPVPGEEETKPRRHDIPRSRWTALSRETHERIHRVEMGMVTMIDDLVGRLIDALREHGLLDNTIVVFTSDHGDQMGEHELLGKFQNTYDASMRVPLIVAGPGVSHGVVVDDLVGLIDVYPTLCDLTGVEPPDAPHNLAGNSLRPLWNGSPDAARDAVYCQFQNAFVIRTAEWKLVHDPTDRCELYDLARDPGETTNLYDHPAHRDAQRVLTARLLDHVTSRRRGAFASGKNGFFG